ncbi:hypothetical protein EMPS_10528 [Entomortierella parvispora]|uniref:Uncharacterized protein n=1 Tax=Entomortierella parvispora TaxID=205924 RepID=A0A9P3HK02_9FUNG|nr:hypothetical protein EMPS_10528 [Entomortierella parvispora]
MPRSKKIRLDKIVSPLGSDDDVKKEEKEEEEKVEAKTKEEEVQANPPKMATEKKAVKRKRNPKTALEPPKPLPSTDTPGGQGAVPKAPLKEGEPSKTLPSTDAPEGQDAVHKAPLPLKEEELPKPLPSIKTREGRSTVLKALLKERGLVLRGDSRLCEQYLSGGVKMDVLALADIMHEMDWYFKNTGYSALARTTPTADAKFTSLKRWVTMLYERSKKDGEKAKTEYVALEVGKRPPNSLWQTIDDMLDTLDEGETIERGGGWVREFDINRRLYPTA